MHKELQLALKLVYEPHGFSIKNFVGDQESKDYGAGSFEINNLRIIFRVAKVTPKKIGQFVTLWKREKGGPIMPFDESDAVDWVMIAIREKDIFGHFLFPRQVLVKQGIFSCGGIGGKRGFRVYPPFVSALNPQAQKTQVWQSKYYFDLNDPNGAKCFLERFGHPELHPKPGSFKT